MNVFKISPVFGCQMNSENVSLLLFVPSSNGDFCLSLPQLVAQQHASEPVARSSLSSPQSFPQHLVIALCGILLLGMR